MTTLSLMMNSTNSSLREENTIIEHQKKITIKVQKNFYYKTVKEVLHS